MSKICKKCRVGKPQTEFYFSRTINFSYVVCKSCKRHEVNSRYKKDIELRQRIKKYNDVYFKTNKGKEGWNKASKKMYKKSPEKFKTRYITRSLVVRGILTHLACEKCGNFLSEIHHLDYSDPYNIWWLCRKHHRMADRSELVLYSDYYD